MNTGYRRQSAQQAPRSETLNWVLLCIAIALCLIALPCTIAGFLAQRLLARWLHWRLNFLVWFVLFFVSAFMLYHDYQQSLQSLISRELVEYISTARHYQTDIAHWPLHQLWSETWPVWVQTLPGIGIAGFCAEVFTDTRQDTVRTLQQQEQSQARRARRSQQRAKRRTSQPTRMPDQIDGTFVIGVAIDDDQEA